MSKRINCTKQIKLLITFLFIAVNSKFVWSSYLSTPIYPKALKPGDTIGIVATAYALRDPLLLNRAVQRLNNLGYKVKVSSNINQKYGYLAGPDKARAKAFNQMILDPAVDGIIEFSGGWGGDRILNLIDYKAIKQHPKVIMGFSDFTSILLAIYKKTGLITFHGPVAYYPLPQETVEYWQQLLCQGLAVKYQNKEMFDKEIDNINTNAIQTITPGRVKGRLIGGNLAVLTSMIGTPYLPDLKKAILYIEDTGEDVYRIDRMLAQLKNAGLLSQISGFIFGGCVNCESKMPNIDSRGGFSLYDLLLQYIKPLGIPAFFGANFGHSPNMFILPEGAVAEIDAERGSIKLIHGAVSIKR